MSLMNLTSEMSMGTDLTIIESGTVLFRGDASILPGWKQRNQGHHHAATVHFHLHRPLQTISHSCPKDHHPGDTSINHSPPGPPPAQTTPGPSGPPPSWPLPWKQALTTMEALHSYPKSSVLIQICDICQSRWFPTVSDWWVCLFGVKIWSFYCKYRHWKRNCSNAWNYYTCKWMIFKALKSFECWLWVFVYQILHDVNVSVG